ncbi:MAG: DUF3793 family protein [Peptococcaceae bacterium]|nr:DUF3793 family protein [Peptococcaceae bacterium]
MLEERIVQFCAPVLTGIKTGGLFNTCELNPETLCSEAVEARKKLNRFGIELRLFFTHGKMPLVYVYRVADLKRDLQDPETQAYLTPLGYTDFRCKAALSHLADRLRDYDGFPHEIGLFLSYPLADVKDFVRFGSKCAKLQGHWCVFHNEEQAKKCFAAYDQSRTVCLSRYREGQPLEALARAI